MTPPETLLLTRNGWVPNNPRLPVLVYRAARADAGREQTAAGFETLFAKNGWPPQWRDGIFDYHHYHSTAHEALGVAAGRARLMLGGPGGTEIAVVAGDALLLPAGTGHCALEASGDFLVVGAYPLGQVFDICRDAPSAVRLRAMAALAIPATDPVEGAGGALCDLWPLPSRPPAD